MLVRQASGRGVLGCGPWARWAVAGGMLVLPLSCGDDRSAAKAPPPAGGCETDDECATGRCDPRVDCVECLFDSDCGNGERCDLRACRTIAPCDDSSDCRGADYPVCDLQVGECVACVEDTDCGGSAHCVSYRCAPFETCTSDDDCETGVCDAGRGECVECVETADCSNGDACVGHRCVTPCAQERDCPEAAPICGPAGYCVECATHSQCPDVYHCAEGRCLLDVCETSETRCDASRRGIESCTISGSGFGGEACAPQQTCDEDAGQPACTDWVCTPESETCDTNGTHVELCSADGLSVASRTDCEARGEICIAGACQRLACAPDAFICEEGDLYRCNEDGTELELDQTCFADERCDAAEETCIPLVCTPGARTCDGDVVATCNNDGSAFTGETTPCKENESCFEGACRPRICVGEYFCDGDESVLCTDRGTRTEVAERCLPDAPAPQYCNPESGRCELVGCDPSQPICIDNMATVCADDGSAPVDGGIDCTMRDEVCFGGSCLPELCAEEYVCQQGWLYHCEDNGSALRLSGECGRPELCDANAGVCLPEVCTPGDAICNGTIATACDETGAGYEPGGTDCAATGEGCSDGACAPVVCDADQFICVEGNVHLCNGSGTTSELIDACDATEHCVDAGDTCEPNTCSPGSAICAGTVATICLPDGSGPTGEGIDCAETGDTCRLGTCEPLVCEPGQRFCENGHVRICDNTGTTSAPYETCSSTEYCEDGPPTRCRARLCTPNDAACYGEVLAICNDDGSGYARFGTNCIVTGAICDLVGACRAEATDTIGRADFPSENPISTMHLTAIEVFTSRALTKLRAYFSVGVDTDVTWVVYVSPEHKGTYSKLLELPSVAGAGGATFHDSETISVLLAPGHYYAFGVVIRGPHTQYQSAIAAEPLSFGAVLGSSQTPTSSAPQQTQLDLDPRRAPLQQLVTQ